MKRWGDLRNAPRTFIQADKTACLVVALLILAFCSVVTGVGVLARPAVTGLVARIGPKPTPTITTARPGTNLAFNRPVIPSNELPDFPGERAVDSSPNDWWSAGDFAPQYIEIDLGASYVVSEFILLPSQSPAGETVHQLYARGPDIHDEDILVHTFKGYTSDNTPLRLKLSEPLRGIRYIRVKTVNSPSWVGWREIMVLAGE